ncbi:MAG: hypothetical protein RIQ79_2348 [Verrucomicrobiota bacterium]
MYGRRPILARARTYWELQWIFTGSPWQCGLEGGELPAKSPCLFISHPDSPHGWADEGVRQSEVFVLHFRAIPEELAGLVKPAKSLILDLSEGEHRQVLARLNEVWELSRGEDARLGLKLGQVLIEVALLVLGREVPSGPRGYAQNRVENALHWFAENIGEHPTVEEVARAVGMSSAHLRRIFAEAGRDAPRTEFAKLQMAAAQRCMSEGWKLERVAAFLGFSEASAFSRAFAASCGCSPRKWLATQR